MWRWWFFTCIHNFLSIFWFIAKSVQKIPKNLKPIKHDQVDGICTLSQKITSRQKKFDALEIEILFYSMINMKINFHFYIRIFLNEHLHVDLNRFYKIASTRRKFRILQNGLQIDKILNFLYFQINET